MLLGLELSNGLARRWRKGSSTLLHLRNLPSYSDVRKLERRLGVIEKQVPALLTGTRTDILRIPAGHISITCGRQAAKLSIPAILQWIRRNREPLA